MPNKQDKIALADPFLKRSCKLLPCQKEMVVWWANQGLSQRKLAAMFHVSRRLIQFICDPKKHKGNLQRRAERGGTMIYYKKERQTVAMQKHRLYKKTLGLPPTQ